MGSIGDTFAELRRRASGLDPSRLGQSVRVGVKSAVEAFRASQRPQPRPGEEVLKADDPRSWVGKARGDALPLIHSAKTTAGEPLQLKGYLDGFQASLSSQELEPGLEEVTIRLSSDVAAPPPLLMLNYEHPLVDASAVWVPGNEYTSAANRDKSIKTNEGFGAVISRAAYKVPLAQLVGSDGTNRAAVSTSDTKRVNVIKPGAVEETSRMEWRIAPFDPDASPAKTHEVKVRIDHRKVRWHEALGKAWSLWKADLGAPPRAIPESAKDDALSTWYLFHKDLREDELREMIDLYGKLGIKKVIIDDGHQELGIARDYSRTGDCIDSKGLPGLKDIVAEAHEKGIKVMLWDPIAFIGVRAEKHAELKDKILFHQEYTDGGVYRGVSILDPRYPEVRQYIVEKYVDAAERFDLDGFKLDFVDNFKARPETPRGMADGRDYSSIDEAVARLLEQVDEALRAKNPEFELEFRRQSVGPNVPADFMRGNDSPFDHVQIRTEIVDTRVSAPDFVAAGDMLQWHPTEPVEAAARHVHSSLFGQMQLSVDLRKLPQSHLDMLQFWLDFRKQTQDVRFSPDFDADSPEENYPQVRARTEDTRLIAAYADRAVRLEADEPATLHIVNDAKTGSLLLEVKAAETRRIRTWTADGKPVRDEVVTLQPGAFKLDVPVSGLATLERVD